MPAGANAKPTVVFAGGGHAHQHSLRRTREIKERGFDVVLVNPSRFLYYSGMAPGLVSRIYRPEEDRIDVRYMVEKGGGRFIKDKVKAIRSREQRVVLESGDEVHYDAMSVCLGSGVPDQNFANSRQHLTPVKPVENMERLHWKLRGFKQTERKNREPRVLVVGGGAAGCEIACNTRTVFEAHGIRGRVILADANDQLLSSAPKRARRKMERFMASRDVGVYRGTRVVGVEEDHALTGDGGRIGFDLMVLATGIKPPSLFRESGLATDKNDGLWVNHYLQSISDPRVFGGGDSVALRGEPLPKLGVFAIRQGPVLYHNLQAIINGEPLQNFRPQSVFLYVLNLGTHEGLAVWGPLVWSGRSAWKLKDYIDRKFMRLYQYPEDKEGEVRDYFERLSEEELADVGRGIGPLEGGGDVSVRVSGEGEE